MLIGRTPRSQRFVFAVWVSANFEILVVISEGHSRFLRCKDTSILYVVYDKIAPNEQTALGYFCAFKYRVLFRNHIQYEVLSLGVYLQDQKQIQVQGLSGNHSVQIRRMFRDVWRNSFLIHPLQK